MTKTLAQIAAQYDTDKTHSGYIGPYERHVGHLRDLPIKLLELGVFRGGSLLMWQEFFAKGLIVGVDLGVNPFQEMPERIRFYQGAQDDSSFLDRSSQQCAPEGFDIIIDDASHIGTLTRRTFQSLFMKHLKPGGFYVIEDWGTGYWDSWADGSCYTYAGNEADAGRAKRNDSSHESPLMPLTSLSSRPQTDADFPAHNFGLVGFIKELVDEIAWPDITHPTRGNPDLPKRPSMIREIALSCGLAFIVKA
jgi:hypothetical protein